MMMNSTIAGFVLGGFMTAAVMPAQGASFDCARAQSHAETMICADPALSSLDETMAKDFRISIGIFDNDSPGSDAITADLRASQKAWLATRDACPNTACLTTALRARVAVLAFHGRPGMTQWADRLAGTYKHQDFITLTVQVKDDSSVLVAISGADPKAARWTCNYAGLGKQAAGGGLAVTSPGGKDAELTLAYSGSGLAVPDTPGNQAASKASCGLNGTLIWTYEKAER